MKPELVKVSSTIFNKFVSDNNLIPYNCGNSGGHVAHSQCYSDFSGVVRAYFETSSYNPYTDYYIEKESGYENYESLTVLTNYIDSLL